MRFFAGGACGGLATLLAAAQAQATYPGSNGVIAYSKSTQAYPYHADIWTINPNGTGAQPLVSASGDGQGLIGAAWSPDGQLLAYFWQHGAVGIWVVNADGSDPHQLPGTAATDHDPAFSPSGRRIAFGRRGTIVSMRLDGSGLRELASGGRNVQPAFSPNGNQIAYAHRPPHNHHHGAYSIWLMRANGANKHRIAKASIFDPYPDWSPSGRRIAFVGSRESVVAVKPDGSKRRVLVSDAAGDFGYSPDGRFLAYIGGDAFKGFELSVARANGHHVRRLTNPTGGIADPAWQPIP